MANSTTTPPARQEMEGGTYEILRKRLETQGQSLRERLQQLNEARKEVFGSIEARLLGADRITTQHNCVPWDMVPLGQHLLFGYNVHLGLKAEISLPDVFSVFRYEARQFHEAPLELINDEQFEHDFKQLYTYYKDTVFIRFAEIGPHLFMIFRIGKRMEDIKAFKWTKAGETLRYLDNRSDHEYRFPEQHEFRWVKTTRDQHIAGKHPHVSIEDRVFVETVGGDLTIKVENNTEEGQGIYAEPVDNPDQTLADAELSYAVIGNLIALRILPYKEEQYRYIIFNSKMQEARRIDDLEDACVLLPDDHGLIFANGYYLQSGEYKLFQNGLRNMLFERKVNSPNGEDYLYIFYNRRDGLYLLLHYNLIEQQVASPITCHGYSIFENGELIYFKGDEEPKKHHAVQIWQTPFVGPNFEVPTSADNYLSKIGNKEIVRAMAECTELLNLLQKDERYDALYVDLIRLTTDLSDSYHWLGHEETFALQEPVEQIRQAANAAVEEYDKVLRIRRNTATRTEEVFEKAAEIERRVKRTRASTINDFVTYLSDLRSIRGEVISLKELRYAVITSIEAKDKSLEELTHDVSHSCVTHLLRDTALQPYEEQVGALGKSVEQAAKVVEAQELDQEIARISAELEMLIEVVSNLEIEDATQTTRIIDNISAVYAQFNQIKAALKNKKQKLLRSEGEAEFNSQLKLVDQGVINYLDICDTPEKCEEYQTKIMVQLEELEGRFPEFDEFVEKISRKREEVYDAFDSRKVQLTEERNRRAATLMSAAERIISAVKSRVARFKEVSEINGYFAADIMISKAREIIKDLRELGDTVKSEDVSSKLKAAKEEALRQLKDKTELFVAGQDLIKLGKHQFAVNTQSLGLSMVPKEGEMYFHLTGTNFYEKVLDEAFLSSKAVWDQSLISENKEVYRAEYLAYQLLRELTGLSPKGDLSLPDLEALYQLAAPDLQKHVQQFMATRFNEGYIKGVHDYDATLMLQTMLRVYMTADLLRYSSQARACALLVWDFYLSTDERETLHHQLKGVGAIMKAFPDSNQFEPVQEKLSHYVKAFVAEHTLFERALAEEAAAYLFAEMSRSEHFVIDAETERLYTSFDEHLKTLKHKKAFEQSVMKLEGHYVLQYTLILQWLQAYITQKELQELAGYAEETAAMILSKRFDPRRVIHIALRAQLSGMKGTHAVLQDGAYQFEYNELAHKLRHFEEETVPLYQTCQERKKELVDRFTEELRLSEFKPRIMSSFVRNRLIDEVYLPLIGDNLAKQIGAAGAGKRTDLMGMLLLLSPPGYGKTTLMEYMANRLGIIFMKINGPAIGHAVTAIDPAEASNAAAREELEKLNLAFEMGDNVMIYLDDIQHCNSEFLQKFISLCDAQRKIEGVYKGRPRTYDFRGKKVAVVMAGNPYTESGDKFQIPDMLANRADIYNLGDIIGGNDSAFKLSYLENCLTSNSILSRLAGKSTADVRKVVQIVESGQREGVEFEANHSAEELQEYLNLMEKLIKVRDIVLKVNQEYIYSAAQADEYRTEPPFKLQGSYRNMNKLAEKLMPVMNEQELETLILSHYTNESQTLTTDAEANLLKFKELYGKLSEEEASRWQSIKETFAKNTKLKGLGGNQIGQVIGQMEAIGSSLEGINLWLTGKQDQNPLD